MQKHSSLSIPSRLWRAALAAVLALCLAGCAGAASGAPQSEAGSVAAASGAAQSEAGGAAASAVAAQPGPVQQNADGSLQFTDDLGRSVTLAGQPQRVVTMIGSYADVWCTAGGAGSIVAASKDAWTDFDLGLPEQAQSIGGTKSPSAEIILACEPDFILASANTSANLELQQTFEQAGIPVAYFGVNDIEDYLRLLAVCTALTGQPERYEQYGLAVQQQVEEIRAQAAACAADMGAPTVLNIRYAASGVHVKSSEDNVMGEILAALGAVNIADSDTSLLENLSMEAILAADPDMIFFVTQGSDTEAAQQVLQTELLSNPAWQQLSAVQQGKVYYMEKALFHFKPNARWAEAYDIMAQHLYGEQYAAYHGE